MEAIFRIRLYELMGIAFKIGGKRLKRRYGTLVSVGSYDEMLRYTAEPYRYDYISSSLRGARYSGGRSWLSGRQCRRALPGSDRSATWVGVTAPLTYPQPLA